MKLTTRDIGEVIAVIGVIVSLLFIGLEFRQSTIASRAAAYQELGLATADLLFDLSDDPELFEAIARAAESRESFQGLSKVDYDTAYNWMRGTLRVYETVYLQVELGLLDSEALDYLGWRNFRHTPWLQNMWPELRSELPEDFAIYIENDWSSN